MKNIFNIFNKKSEKERLEEENFRLKGENARLEKTVDHLMTKVNEKK